MRPFHTTLFRYKKEEENPDEPFVELPKKGKMPVPKEIKELGDKVLSLNAIDNMILSQYLRVSVKLYSKTYRSCAIMSM